MFPLIILTRILFAACMVFVIGYVFGNFSKRKTLSTLSRVAAILAIVLFFVANGLAMRFGGWHRGDHGQHNHCYNMQKDSATIK